MPSEKIKLTFIVQIGQLFHHCDRNTQLSPSPAWLPFATVVAERLCFHMCLSVHREGGGVHPPAVDTPPSRRLLQRTLRILLECILVKLWYWMMLGNALSDWSTRMEFCSWNCTLPPEKNYPNGKHEFFRCVCLSDVHDLYVKFSLCLILPSFNIGKNSHIPFAVSCPKLRYASAVCNGVCVDVLDICSASIAKRACPGNNMSILHVLFFSII